MCAAAPPSASNKAMNANQALELVLDGTTTELDSGDETDIDGDASFPLPVDEESEQSEYEGKIYTFCQHTVKQHKFCYLV